MGNVAPAFRPGANRAARISSDQKRGEASCGKRNDQPKIFSLQRKLGELIPSPQTPPTTISATAVARLLPPTYHRRRFGLFAESWIAIEESGCKRRERNRSFRPCR